MNNRPREVSASELREMAVAPAPMWERWGCQNAEEMLDVIKEGYCVKFDFMNGGPGYVGDLFIFQGACLGDAHPVEFTRGRDGKLQIVQYA